MKTIRIRTNYQRAQEPFPEGRLLFDERHAIYVADGGVFMVPVVPLDYDGLYGQDGDNIGLGRVRNNDPAVIDEIFSLLMGLSAFELITRYTDPESDAFYLLKDEELEDDSAIPEYDQYGRLA